MIQTNNIMKKSTLFMACCIGLLFFASCKKDVQPTITVVAGTGYIGPNAAVYSGDPILVGFDVTGENLIQVMLTAEQNGTSLFTHSETIENAAAYSYTKTFTVDATGVVTIRGTVTDAKGNTATKSFDVNFNEKPNAKFVGHYEGDILVSGDVNINVNNMEPLNQVLDNESVPTVIDIVAGDGIDEVIASITINGHTNTVNGTVNGNRALFEAINDDFEYQYNYQGIDINIPLKMTYTVNATLNGDQLSIDGTCKGNGTFNLLFIYNGTFELDITIGGSFNKMP